MWMFILIPLLIILIVVTMNAYQNKKQSDVHMNSYEHQERPTQQKVTDRNQSHASENSTEPPPT
ncbi:hypothetical protein [Pseudalkalibacillus berkeleyi]|uniref:Uncharacterized protein n=1 Tax=Pseudalkalibacillus berkeleyi TaxID=1069813 RepID=A0ABS9GUF4_9BACL|nr:hypothetical protein [Pseudalkalibacillus berkeleyi]MCF6136314.1 hypothetical protein [Pseudalkalibacillus berkeleyi]